MTASYPASSDSAGSLRSRRSLMAGPGRDCAAGTLTDSSRSIRGLTGRSPRSRAQHLDPLRPVALSAQTTDSRIDQSPKLSRCPAALNHSYCHRWHPLPLKESNKSSTAPPCPTTSVWANYSATTRFAITGSPHAMRHGPAGKQPCAKPAADSGLRQTRSRRDPQSPKRHPRPHSQKTAIPDSRSQFSRRTSVPMRRYP